MKIWHDQKLEKGTRVEYFKTNKIYVVTKCVYEGTFDNREHYTLTVKLEKKDKKETLQ